MKKKRNLSQKQIENLLEKKEKKEKELERPEIRKRYFFIIGIIALLSIYVINIQLNYNKYAAYDDSSAITKYNELMQNFNNLTKYHLQYKTSVVRGSVETDVYFIKDKLFLIKYTENGMEKSKIYTPDRTQMNLSSFLGKTENCSIFFGSADFLEKDYTCSFEIGMPSKNEAVPINIELSNNDTLISNGKLYLTEETMEGEQIFCFDRKIDVPLLNPSSMFGLGKYLPALTRLLQGAPPQIKISDHRCYTQTGVLVQTHHYEKFMSISYDFDESIISYVPLYNDFQKFVNKSASNRSKYLKVSIGNIATYFKDFDNYATLGSFDHKEYFTSGCANGSLLGYVGPCNHAITQIFFLSNKSYYPFEYTRSEVIANESVECFRYKDIDQDDIIEKDFCIMDGGYMVSENFTIDGKTEGYSANSIQEITFKEFDLEMRRAVYLSSLK